MLAPFDALIYNFSVVPPHGPPDDIRQLNSRIWVLQAAEALVTKKLMAFYPSSPQTSCRIDSLRWPRVSWTYWAGAYEEVEAERGFYCH